MLRRVLHILLPPATEDQKRTEGQENRVVVNYIVNYQSNYSCVITYWLLVLSAVRRECPVEDMYPS